MDPKLKFSLISAAVALLSYFSFKYLNALLNKFVRSTNPEYQNKYPWVFTRKNHIYVFLIMPLKLCVVVALIWLELIGTPEFFQS